MIIIQKPPLPYAARAVCYLLLRNPTATMIAASSTAALMPSQIQPDVPSALSCADQNDFHSTFLLTCDWGPCFVS